MIITWTFGYPQETLGSAKPKPEPETRVVYVSKQSSSASYRPSSDDGLGFLGGLMMGSMLG